MKKMILTLALLAVTMVSQAQRIKIIDIIDGPVKIKGRTTPLKVGETITIADQLQFKSSCELVCEVTGEGMFRISKKSDPRSELNQAQSMFTLVKKMFFPIKKSLTLGYRSSELCHNLAELNQHFSPYSSDSTRLLIVGSHVVNLAKQSFDDLGPLEFFVTYRYHNEDIAKVLNCTVAADNPDNLRMILDERLFFVDGKPIDSKQIKSLDLLVFHKQKKESYPVVSFNIRYASKDELLPKLNRISSTKSQLDYLHYYYGSISKTDLENLIKQQ